MTVVSTKISQDREQFRGVFENIWAVKAHIDTASIPHNSYIIEIITVPGLKGNKDVVLGWNRHTLHTFGMVEYVYVDNNDIHLVIHNTSGGSHDPSSSDYTFIVGRVINT